MIDLENEVFKITRIVEKLSKHNLKKCQELMTIAIEDPEFKDNKNGGAVEISNMIYHLEQATIIYRRILDYD